MIPPRTLLHNPDTLLQVLRDLIATCGADSTVNWRMAELMETFEDLDQFLTDGGELPTPWRR